MKKLPFLLLTFIVIGMVGWFAFLINQGNLQILNSKGMIGAQESFLIIFAMSIMLSVAIPVVIIAFLVGWKYRAGSKKPYHLSDYTGNSYIKIGFWMFLGSFVVLFSIVVWISAHRLDPYKQIVSDQKSLTVQVVALDWKWLFIYPEQNIATINFLQIPINTPINFKLTADGPMNSFWIPSLGGQIYSMATMETKLNLIANKPGDFPGGAAEINGKGFSGMRFTTRATSKVDFDAWVKKVYGSSNPLTQRGFEKLNIPSEDNPVMFYSSVDPNLYNNIIMKYMAPVNLSPKAEKTQHDMNMEGVDAK